MPCTLAAVKCPASWTATMAASTPTAASTEVGPLKSMLVPVNNRDKVITKLSSPVKGIAAGDRMVVQGRTVIIEASHTDQE